MSQNLLPNDGRKKATTTTKKAHDICKKGEENKAEMKSFYLALPSHFKKFPRPSLSIGQGELRFILVWTNMKTMKIYLTKEGGINHFDCKYDR